MKCFIYKSLRKDGAYLYLASKDGFSDLPDSLQTLFGNSEFVMELDLAVRKQLASADIRQVILQLRQSGYYLQLPPADHARA